MEKRLTKYIRKAKELKHPLHLSRLLRKSKTKWEDNKPKLGVAKDELGLFFKMTSDSLKGTYKLPYKSFLMITAAILYFVNPADMIPDIIAGVGFIDDIAVIRYVYKTIKKDIADYKASKTI